MLFRFITYMSLFIALSACGLSPSTVPEEHFYRLSDAAKTIAVTKDFKQLQLADVKASGIYNERAILYRDVNKPLEINRYNYHFWSQAPAKLVHDYMQQYLHQSGIVKSIQTESLKRSSAAIIQTEIMHFERLMDKQQAIADVSLRLSVGGVSKIYTAQLKADSTDMHATVEAFSRALSQIMQSFKEELIHTEKL